MVSQGLLGIPQEGKGIPFWGVSEKREGGKGTQSLVVIVAAIDDGATTKQWFRGCWICK